MIKALARNMGVAALILSGFAIVGTGLVAITYLNTKDLIAESQRAALEASLNQLVPTDRYDNRIIEDRIDVVAPDSSLFSERCRGTQAQMAAFRRNGQALLEMAEAP